MSVLNSSFCQFIEYQDAHATLSTESTDYILNSVCNFTTFGKELPMGSAFLVFSKYYVCSLSIGLNIAFKF